MSDTNITITGTGTFNDATANGGVIGAGEFTGTSINTGTVTTSATFAGSSSNSGVANTAVFQEGATNTGTVSSGTFLDGATNTGSVSSGVFAGSAVNAGTVTSAEFTGTAVNTGTVTLSAVFGGSSTNDGEVAAAVFGNESVNTGVVVGAAIFADTSTNTGTVSGDAQFSAGASNSGTVQGAQSRFYNWYDDESAEDNYIYMDGNVNKVEEGGLVAAEFDGNGFFTISNILKNEPAGTDWTLEMWVKPSNDALYDEQYHNIAGNVDRTGVDEKVLEIFTVGNILVGNVFGFGTGDSILLAATEFYNDSYTHVAVSVANNVATFYCNGVAFGSGTIPDITGLATNFTVGNNMSGQPFLGRITEIRFVRGTALYTTDFAVPTTKLEEIAGTKLLMTFGSTEVPPYPSPTPTSTPTQTPAVTPTVTVTPTNAATPTPTPSAAAAGGDSVIVNSTWAGRSSNQPCTPLTFTNLSGGELFIKDGVPYTGTVEAITYINAAEDTEGNLIYNTTQNSSWNEWNATLTPVTVYVPFKNGKLHGHVLGVDINTSGSGSGHPFGGARMHKFVNGVDQGVWNGYSFGVVKGAGTLHSRDIGYYSGGNMSLPGLEFAANSAADIWGLTHDGEYLDTGRLYFNGGTPADNPTTHPISDYGHGSSLNQAIIDVADQWGMYNDGEFVSVNGTHSNRFYLNGQLIPHYSYVFDGSSSLIKPHESALDVSGSDFTAECWYKVTEYINPGNTFVIFAKGMNWNNYYYGEPQSDPLYTLYAQPEQNVLITSAGNGIEDGEPHYVTHTNTINTWYHAAVVGDGTTNEIKIYIDGVLIDTFTLNTPIGENGKNLLFGMQCPTWPNSAKGKISNFRLIKGQKLYSGNSFTVPNNVLTTTGYGYTSQGITGSVFLLANATDLGEHGDVTIDYADVPF